MTSARARLSKGETLRQGIGGGLVTLGFIASGIDYLLTAFVFFSRGDNLLGFIQLVVPPAELVLPWVADTTLGVISLASFALILLGASLTEE